MPRDARLPPATRTCIVCVTCPPPEGGGYGSYSRLRRHGMPQVSVVELSEWSTKRPPTGLRARPYTNRPLLDSFDALRDDDAVDEDARRVDAVRIELARFDELLDLGDADLSRRRRHRIEVSRGLPVDEIAEAVRLLRGNE